MKKQKGFTVIEVAVAFVVLVVLAVFFVIQRADLEKTNNDQQRKIAVNTMYYALVNSYYKENGYYPRTISRDTLTVVDPTLFTDPSGYTLEGDKCTYTNDNDEQKDDGKCEYNYAATDCDSDGKCQEFTISAEMETEETYKKSSK